ncbi:MAG: hypothetical protein AAGA16_10100, partial [Cyanobacteria bacterium P01_E01_bin.35]
MAITIYGSDYDALWQETNPASGNLKSEGYSETLRLVPERLGQGYIQSIDFHGINLSLFNYQLHEDLYMIMKGEDVSYITREFGFCLSGHRYGYVTGENFLEWGSFDFPNEHAYYITYAKEPILKIDIHLELADELGQSIAEILEELPTETRERICDRDWLQAIDIITPAMRSAVMQIINCPFQGKTKQIYLESKCLELITLKLEQLKYSDRPTEKLVTLKSDDI